MRMSGKPRAVRGFTLLELVVVVCLVGIFASVALDRLLRYQEIAEKTAMEATIGALRSAQALQVAARILSGGLPAVKSLSGQNPIDWLTEPPQGYLGALHNPSLEEVPRGGWYFDLKSKELVYRPKLTRFLTALDSDERLRFRILLSTDVVGSEISGISEMGIRPVNAVRWAPEY
jgi:prepilin-type N-terminal cleavage/methylation domain-containing protein